MTFPIQDESGITVSVFLLKNKECRHVIYQAYFQSFFDRAKGNWLKTLCVLVSAVSFGLPSIKEAWSQMSESEMPDWAKEKIRRAEIKAAQEVEELYSTKPVRVVFGRREYVIPANYFGPKEKNGLDTFDAGKVGYFGFFLFLPDYNGYTKNNWKDKFDHHLVTVLEISTVDKERIVSFTDGHTERVNPAQYGEPKARFQNGRSLLEEKPSLSIYGLQGYRPKHGNLPVTFVGTRSNGEFLFFDCHLAPGDAPTPGLVYPFCDVRYYSEKEDLFIAYRYSNDYLAQWRDIDDAIWRKVHSWQVR
jgi:hypothetical protein